MSSSPAADAPLAVQYHRPWPLPRRPWVLRQSWRDVLFAHWPVDPWALRPLIPSGLQLDVASGAAWIGVVAFEATDGRARALPPMPGLSRFLEVNVRTYVTLGGRPGVYFFSLDADSRLAVAGARVVLSLPYFRASMAMRRERRHIHFRSERRGASCAASLDVVYAPLGHAFHAGPGTLDAFLTERYCLFACRRHRLYQLEIHHPPWPLREACARLDVNTLLDPLGIGPIASGSPLLHYADRQDMLAWWPTLP